MTDDEDAIRRWWDEARHRRRLFEARQPSANQDDRSTELFANDP